MFIHSKLLLWHNAYTTFNKYQWPYCFSGVYVEIQRFPSSSSLNAKLIGSSLMLYIQWYHLTFNKKTSEHIFNIVCFNNKQKHSYLQWEGLWSCMAPRQICCHILWGRHAHWSLFINWRRYRRESEGFHKIMWHEQTGECAWGEKRLMSMSTPQAPYEYWSMEVYMH